MEDSLSSLGNLLVVSDYNMLNKYGKRTRDIFERFYFYFNLVFYIFRAFQ